MVSPNVVELDGEFTHRMLHTRGVRLHVADAASASSELILLLHGALGAWVDFKDVIAPLASHGYHVAALDLRGYGMSDKPAHRAGSWLHILLGDVHGAIHTLGHTTATVVGADTGAIIARAAAARNPQVIKRVVALPPSRGLAAYGARVSPRLLGASARVKDHIWRASLAADTSPAFHNTPRFEEFLHLRTLAREIDHALPHIVETSRLRPVLPGLRRGAGVGSRAAAPVRDWFSAAPHIEDPDRFVETLIRTLR